MCRSCPNFIDAETPSSRHCSTTTTTTVVYKWDASVQKENNTPPKNKQTVPVVSENLSTRMPNPTEDEDGAKDRSKELESMRAGEKRSSRHIPMAISTQTLDPETVEPFLESATASADAWSIVTLVRLCCGARGKKTMKKECMD